MIDRSIECASEVCVCVCLGSAVKPMGEWSFTQTEHQSRSSDWLRTPGWRTDRQTSVANASRSRSRPLTSSRSARASKQDKGSRALSLEVESNLRGRTYEAAMTTTKTTTTTTMMAGADCGDTDKTHTAATRSASVPNSDAPHLIERAIGRHVRDPSASAHNRRKTKCARTYRRDAL